MAGETRVEGSDEIMRLAAQRKTFNDQTRITQVAFNEGWAAALKHRDDRIRRVMKFSKAAGNGVKKASGAGMIGGLTGLVMQTGHDIAAWIIGAEPIVSYPPVEKWEAACDDVDEKTKGPKGDVESKTENGT